MQDTIRGIKPAHAPGNPGKQVILLWLAFFVTVVILNGTIPFALGFDLHAWTTSPYKSVLFGLIFYGLFFLAIPLVLIKGWPTVRQPGFLLPLCVALFSLSLWNVLHGLALIALVVLIYLHRRYDLSGYGIRSRGWRGDLLAILIMGALGLVPLLLRPQVPAFALNTAVLTALDRLLANPASTVENLFYFGVLAERLSLWAGKWLTPLLVGFMYTAHEMSNPEYWYGGVSFAFIFVGVTIWAAIYLWRRGVIAIWLGDGLYRLTGALL